MSAKLIRSYSLISIPKSGDTDGFVIVYIYIIVQNNFCFFGRFLVSEQLKTPFQAT